MFRAGHKRGRTGLARACQDASSKDDGRVGRDEAGSVAVRGVGAILAVSVVQLVVGNGLFWLVFAVLMICGTWLMQRAGRQDRRHR